jgi:ATP-dependent protease Clp ATPase subunit
LLKLDEIELTFTTEALDQIAENTLTLKTGARGLHTEIERVLMCHMYHTKKYRKNKVKLLNIDREQVINPKPII